MESSVLGNGGVEEGLTQALMLCLGEKVGRSFRVKIASYAKRLETRCAPERTKTPLNKLCSVCVYVCNPVFGGGGFMCSDGHNLSGPLRLSYSDDVRV
jgi:hypothetical protein